MMKSFKEYWADHAWNIIGQIVLIVMFIGGQAVLVEYRLTSVETQAADNNKNIESIEKKLSGYMVDQATLQSRVVTLLELMREDVRTLKMEHRAAESAASNY